MITQQSSLLFQQAIIANGLDFIRAEKPKNQIIITRESPALLQITVGMMEPQIGQILMVAPQPKGPIDLFVKEAEASLKAFESVWGAPNRQIIKCDATIRELYETTSEHAFQELWEDRLSQPSDALSAFERPIRGGGLRFVMDPKAGEDDPVQIEIKIESFLRDTTKIFVETQFNWLRPTEPGTPFNAHERLTLMNSYIGNQVNSFLSGDVT